MDTQEKFLTFPLLDSVNIIDKEPFSSIPESYKNYLYGDLQALVGLKLIGKETGLCGSEFRFLRSWYGLSQPALGERLNVSSQLIARAEKTNPSVMLDKSVRSLVFTIPKASIINNLKELALNEKFILGLSAFSKEATNPVKLFATRMDYFWKVETEDERNIGRVFSKKFPLVSDVLCGINSLIELFGKEIELPFDIASQLPTDPESHYFKKMKSHGLIIYRETYDPSAGKIENPKYELRGTEEQFKGFLSYYQETFMEKKQ